MTIKASGTFLKFSEIAAEFGYPTNNKFGNYRNTTNETGWDLGDLPLDTGIPTSGALKFSDFYSKQLNVVVNCYDNNANTDYHVNARDEWDNNNVVVVGDTNGTKKDANSKVIIHVNKEIGSASGGYSADTAGKETQRGKCALRTGTGWDSTTKMVIDLGDSARLRGAGGGGGKGNKPSDSDGDNPAPNAMNGKEGTSGLGIQFGTSSNKTIINVNSSAVIRAGYGGGGGGGGSYFDEGKGGGHPYPGTGGGGGAGWPVGAGGAAGDGAFGDGADANPGNAGTRTDGGAKGDGTSSSNKQGGDGGDSVADAEDGTMGVCDAGCSVNGVGGGNGKALRSTGASNTYTLNNNGSIVGGTKNSADVS